jgi:hypothetical protein
MPMRALKILVIVMGVMLLAGFATLIVMIAGRLSRGPATAPFAAPAIDVPAGARIEAMSVGGDRLVLDIILPDGSRRLMIIDPATGHLLGAVPLRTMP